MHLLPLFAFPSFLSFCLSFSACFHVAFVGPLVGVWLSLCKLVYGRRQDWVRSEFDKPRGFLEGECSNVSACARGCPTNQRAPVRLPGF